MSYSLKLTLYGRLGTKPQLVLRKNKLLYRIPHIAGIRAAECKLNRFGYDLLGGVLEPLVLTIENTRGRQWLLEAGMNGEAAVLFLYEVNTGVMKACFKWKGEMPDLAQAMKRLRY